MSDLWNKCDVCGKLISYDDFATGAATRELVTPDSEFSREEYETLCKIHREMNVRRDPQTGMVQHEFAVCMAMDAFRLAMGLPLKNFARMEVLRWLKLAPQAAMTEGK